MITFFFFQAEDGIRDFHVTGVQTCALPIWITTGPKTKLFEQRIAEYTGASKAVCLNSATAAMEMTLRLLGIGKERSEERRVGKECISWWSLNHEKKRREFF